MDFEDAYPLINAQALIEAWPNYRMRLSSIIAKEHSRDRILTSWADDIASVLIMCKLLRRRNPGKSTLRGSLENIIEKLIIFRPVLVCT